MIKKALIIAVFFLLISEGLVLAQDQAEVVIDYPEDGLVVDSDLDGLTDEGEKQLFKTDPASPDSDGDGIYDGVEVINETDPLNNSDPVATRVISDPSSSSSEDIPWAWYLSRSSALVGFALLYFSIFSGLAIRTPGLNRIIAPVNSLKVHSWISLQALLFAFVHGTSLLFDKFIGFSLGNVFIPFWKASEEGNLVDPTFLALGIVSFYLMLALVVTSYLRKYINFHVWRAIHFLNIGLYLSFIIHALYLGTDLQEGTLLRSIFIYANVILVAIMFFSLASRLGKSLFRRTSVTE